MDMLIDKKWYLSDTCRPFGICVNSCIYLLFAGLFLAGLSGCNKNSMQLPQIQTPNFFKSCRMHDSEKIRVGFIQDKSASDGVFYVQVQNQTDKDLNNVSVFIAMRNNLAKTYEAWPENQQAILQVGTLKASHSVTLQAPFSVVGIQESLTEAALISCSGIVSPIAGVYSNINAGFEKTGLSKTFPGSVKGYIAADGETVFRFKDIGNVFWEIDGRFVDTTHFHDARLLNKDDVVQQIVLLDTLNNSVQHMDATGGTLQMRVMYQGPFSPTDSIRSIRINLKKN